jgi:hypothetical protein
MNIPKHIRNAVGAASVALAFSSFGVPAQAADVKVGVLNCDVGGGWGFILGSSKDLRCIYSPVSGETERYVGTVSKFGLDIGYTRSGVIVWEVVAPSLHTGKGALQGGYAGATASAVVGVGGGAHVLVGGFDRSISLQPISIAGEKGLNIAAGIGAISLKHVI